MFRILMADDDPDDCMITREALEEAGLAVHFETVHDGESLLDYLFRRGKFESRQGQPYPELILLDLNMPLLDGREALRAIRAEPTLKHIPVMAFTTSSDESEVRRMYGLGVNSFLVKPVAFDKLVEMMKTLCHYWFETAKLPSRVMEGPLHA